jgi:hypothetical protein
MTISSIRLNAKRRKYEKIKDDKGLTLKAQKLKREIKHLETKSK